MIYFQSIYKVVQWCCSYNNECNVDYLESMTNKADICVMQNCDDKFLNVVKNKFKFVFHKKHSKEMSLVIASNFEFTNPTAHDLPGKNKATATEDVNQGSLSLSVYFKNLQLVVFQTVFDNEYDQVTITPRDAYKDLKHVFKNIVQGKNCLIPGNTHDGPYPPTNVKKLFTEANLTSHTDQLVTFVRINEDNITQGCMHDRVFTRGDVAVSNLQSYHRPIQSEAHFILTYTLTVKND